MFNYICIHADIHTVVATCSSGLTNHSDAIDGPSRLFWGSGPCSRTPRLQGPRTDDLCINGASILALGLLSSFKQSLLLYFTGILRGLFMPSLKYQKRKSWMNHVLEAITGAKGSRPKYGINPQTMISKWFLKIWPLVYVNSSQPALLHVSLEGAHLLLNWGTCRKGGR